MPAKTIPALSGRTIYNLLFDLGDTLWTRKDSPTWTRLEQEANEQVVALLRSRLLPDDLPALDDLTLGTEVRKIVERQIREAKRQFPEYEPNFELSVLHGLRLLGIPGTDMCLGEDIYEALRVPILPSRTIFPDVFPTLAALRERGFQLGVATNRHWGGEPFFADLRAMGFLDYFSADAIAVSADIGLRKPHARVFRYALNALSAAPMETAMVGDSLSADVVGARCLDMFAIWKPKPHLYAEAKALHRASQANSQAQAALVQQVYALENLYQDIQEPSPPLDTESADDEYLLDYARSRESKRKQHLQREMKPDMIIEHVSDLLDVFIEPGRQG